MNGFKKWTVYGALALATVGFSRCGKGGSNEVQPTPVTKPDPVVVVTQPTVTPPKVMGASALDADIVVNSNGTVTVTRISFANAYNGAVEFKAGGGVKIQYVSNSTAATMTGYSDLTLPWVKASNTCKKDPGSISTTDTLATSGFSMFVVTGLDATSTAGTNRAVIIPTGSGRNNGSILINSGITTTAVGSVSSSTWTNAFGGQTPIYMSTTSALSLKPAAL